MDNVTYKKGFNNAIFTEYKTSGSNVIVDLNKQSFIIQDYTIYLNSQPVGLLRLVRPKKLKVFDTLEWSFCQIWVSELYRNQGVAKGIINKLIDRRDNLKYLFFNINKTQRNLGKFIKKLNGKKININSNLYNRFKLNNQNYDLYYIDVQNKKINESIESNQFEEVYFDEDNHIKVIKNKKNKQILLLEYYNQIYILPYKRQDKNLHLLLEVGNQLFGEDFLMPISKKYTDKDEKITKKGHLLLDVLNENGINIVADENKSLNIINYLGEFYHNPNININKSKMYLIDLSDTDTYEDRIRQITNKTLRWIPVSKALSKSKCGILNNLILLLYKHLHMSKYNKQMEDIQNESMSVASLPSYETLDGKDKKVYKDEYPEGISINDNIVNHSYKILMREINKKGINDKLEMYLEAEYMKQYKNINPNFDFYEYKVIPIRELILQKLIPYFKNVDINIIYVLSMLFQLGNDEVTIVNIIKKDNNLRKYLNDKQIKMIIYSLKHLYDDKEPEIIYGKLIKDAVTINSFSIEDLIINTFNKLDDETKKNKGKIIELIKNLLENKEKEYKLYIPQLKPELETVIGETKDIIENNKNKIIQTINEIFYD